MFASAVGYNGVVRRISIALAMLASCTAPSYHSGALQCATSGRACPDRFHCATDQRCWKNGEDPTPGVDLGGADFAGVDLAMRDLAMRDLAMGDLAAPGGDLSSVGSCATAKLCETFDSATLNARWSQSLNGGTVTVDTTRFYRGTSSAHFHTNAISTPTNDPQANLYTGDGFPISGTAYLRAWAYFQSPFPTGFGQALNFANSSGNGASFGHQSANPVLNDYTDGTFKQSSSTTIPTDQWVCLQMQLSQTGPNGPIRLFVNSNEVTDASAASAAAPLMNRLYIGLDWTSDPSSQPAGDLWLDELILDDKPTSCAE
jgi:hypothetical protein